MNGFLRKDQLFSLCGLNCGLCVMHFDKRCPGCGGGAGNQACKIARCSLTRDNIQYCYECGEYPCEKYEHIDEYDSFITHQRQKTDLNKAKMIGLSAYHAEQREKADILHTLLTKYNDGRRKTFYCVAVNLLELTDIQHILEQIKHSDFSQLTHQEACAHIALLFQETAARQNIELKLNKKKTQREKI